jgi:class 3 adenylate cyclase
MGGRDVDDQLESGPTELPRGTVSFLFTDIEGSTRLERELRERYGEVLADHQRLLRRAFERYGGREIDTQGDSFFVVFPRASDAVSAAVEVQRVLVSHPWPGGQQVRVRIGMHTGEASLSEGRYFGLAVHRAARISAAGHGGQILLSSSTRDVVADDLPSDELLLDLGVYRLKDLPRPERVFQPVDDELEDALQLVVDGLPSRFPPLSEEQELPEAARAALAPSRRRRALLFLLLASLAAIPAVGLALLLGRGGGDERSDARRRRERRRVPSVVRPR